MCNSCCVRERDRGVASSTRGRPLLNPVRAKQSCAERVLEFDCSLTALTITCSSYLLLIFGSSFTFSFSFYLLKLFNIYSFKNVLEAEKKPRTREVQGCRSTDATVYLFHQVPPLLHNHHIIARPNFDMPSKNFTTCRRTPMLPQASWPAYTI